jgi:tRNA threonylcarbamoyladenosine biosynthesis protein TsaB
MRAMPKILAIETSSECASAALLLDHHLLERRTQGVTTHSQSILPMVQSLLHEAGIPLSECDAIAFGAGPGSFTGVRTACGVVQGLAFSVDVPVIPVVTLLALAEAARNQSAATQFVTALDARMGEVYWAQYRYEAQQWITVVEPTLCAPAMVTPVGNELELIGNGFAAYFDQFSFAIEGAADVIPEASAIARLAQIELTAGRVYSAQQAQPLYLRNKIALTIEERQHKR